MLYVCLKSALNEKISTSAVTARYSASDFSDKVLLFPTRRSVVTGSAFRWSTTWNTAISAPLQLGTTSRKLSQRANQEPTFFQRLRGEGFSSLHHSDSFRRKRVIQGHETFVSNSFPRHHSSLIEVPRR